MSKQYYQSRKGQVPVISEAKIPIETAAKLARQLQLHSWDFIIAGDGSATTWDNTAGFGSILYSRHDGSERKFFGGFSNGTNNVAEMMAVVLPLLYLEGTLDFKKIDPPNVYVISDSTYVVNAGNGESEVKSNQALWQSIKLLQAKMNLLFVHENRNVLGANKFGDRIGNYIRIRLNEDVKKLRKP